MGHSILGRMDDMGTRMDELEQSIASLLQQAGLDKNGFSNNTSFDTTVSFTSQAKTNAQRLSAHSSNSNNHGAAASPTVSIQPPVTVMNNSPLISSLSHIVSPTRQDVTVTPARARVTIEI